MKKILKSIVACAAIGTAGMSHAALITQSDIINTVVNAPSGWTTMNETVLFNGITSQSSPSTERFVGLRNSGNALSVSNPFDISITFNSLMNLSSFGLFNDWGNVMNQQISSIELSGFDAGSSLVASQTLTGLNTGSFAPSIVSLGAFSGLDIKSLTVSITGIANTNFEIRELAIEANSVAVSAPAMGSLMALMGTGLFLRRRQSKK